MSTLHVLSRHTLHFFILDENNFYHQLLLLNQKFDTYIYSIQHYSKHVPQPPLSIQAFTSSPFTQHNTIVLFYFISMKMIATSSHTNTLLVTSIYQIKIGRTSASRAHTTHLRESRERIVERFQRREVKLEKEEPNLLYCLKGILFSFLFLDLWFV